MADWDDLMTETVTIEPYLSQDAYGATTYDESVEILARVEGRVRVVRAANGEERVSTVTVYLRECHDVDVRDRLTLPDGWTPSQPALLAVSRTPDERGTIFETLYA